MSKVSFLIQCKVNGKAISQKIGKTVIIVGRSPACDFVISSAVVSGKHLKIVQVGEKISVIDLGSTNKTFLNGEELRPHKSYLCNEKDSLYIHGDKMITFRIVRLAEGGLPDPPNEDQFELSTEVDKIQKPAPSFVQSKRPIVMSAKYSHAPMADDQNLLQNISFLVSNASYSKAKKIKETKEKVDSLIRSAKEEIKKEREIFEAEKQKSKEESELEASKRIIEAKEQAKSIVEEAQNQADSLKKKAKEHQVKERSKADQKFEEIISSAQNKSSQIIEEAYIKNKELKSENQKLEDKIHEDNGLIEKTKTQIAQLILDKKNWETQLEQGKVAAGKQMKLLEELNDQVSALEKRNLKEKTFLETGLPELEKHVAQMKSEKLSLEKDIIAGTSQLRSLDVELKNQTQQIEEAKLEVRDHRKLIVELNEKVTDCEQNLFNLVEIKKQRFAEVEDEVKRRRDAQDKIEAEAQAEISRLREEADQELEAFTLSQRTQIVDSAEAKAEALVSEAEERSQSLVGEAKSESQRLLNEAKAEAQDLLEGARDESQSLLDKAKAESQDLLQEVKNQADASLERAKLSIEKDKEHARKEIEKLKKEAETEVNTFKSDFVAQLADQKAEIEEAELEKSRIRLLKLQKDLNSVLRSRITPYLADPEKISEVSSIVDKSISSIVGGNADEGYIASDEEGSLDPLSQQQRVKKFWYLSASGAVVAVLVLFLLPKFEKAAVEAGRSIAAQDLENTKEKIENTKKEKDLSTAFVPLQTDEYHESYTERVLYTKGYTEIELSGDFREKWIIALQDYFTDKLNISENDLVPFIAQEANMVRELSEEMKKINGTFVEQGIARMEEIEASFVNKLKKNLKKKSDFKKIMKFKKKFFLENKSANL